MVRRNVLSLVLLSVICLTLAPAIASADDFAPPPWPRTDIGAITAEWEFITPANPTLPDGPLTNVFTKGGGSVTTLATITGHGIGWGSTSGGNWFFPDSGSIRFRVDNVIDFEPFKHIRMQVTHSPGLDLYVDPLFSFNLGATGSTVTGGVATIPFDPFHTLFSWDMTPNPPWEDFTLFVGSGGEIRQVVVDTISTGIPEPSTFVWYSVALLSLGLVFRTCPRLWKQALN